MAYDASERYTVALYTDHTFGVPAVEQERQNLGYNDEIEVTVYPENDVINSLTFTGYMTSAGRVTLPIDIRRRIDVGDTITLGFDATGKKWTPEVGRGTARKSVYESAHPEKTSLAATDLVLSDD